MMHPPLDAFVDGESADAAGHVAACPSCSRDVDALRALKRCVAAMPLPPAPEGLLERALAPRRRWIPWTAAAAAVVLIAFGVINIAGALPPEVRAAADLHDRLLAGSVAVQTDSAACPLCRAPS